MARRNPKKDGNHKGITDIVAELRDKHGQPIDFEDITHSIKGIGDTNIYFGQEEVNGILYIPNVMDKHLFRCGGGITIVAEIKRQGEKLNAKQQKYVKKKPYGGKYVCRTFEELLSAIEDSLYNIYRKHPVHGQFRELVNTYYEKILKKDPREWENRTAP